MDDGADTGAVAPMAEFDRTPPEEGSQGTLPLDDLPPPPPQSAGSAGGATAISITDAASSAPTSAQSETTKEKKKKKEKEAKEKHYQQSDDIDDDMSCGRWCEYVLVVVLASLLLLSALILVLFWALYYRKGFAWQESPEHQFNLHPTLMVAGFISFSGFSMLLYRISRCCRQIYVKLFHMLFHALAIPCIVIGFIAVWDSKTLSVPPIKNFYSMHSWMGLITMGLFALQFVVGFFSFLILLCCEGATAAFRAALVPIHASFGVTTFMLAVATCLTGLTQKAILQFGKPYTEGFTYESLLMNIIAMVLVACSIVVSYALNRVDYFKYQGRILVPDDGDFKDYASWPEESIIMNALAMVLVALGILVSYAVRRDSFGRRPGTSQDGGKFISERL